MTYIQQIQNATDADALAALIAAEGIAVKERLIRDMDLRLAAFRTHAAHRAAKARYEAEIDNILGQLRTAWQMANDGTPEWRDTLTGWIEAHEPRAFRWPSKEGHDRAVRLRLIVQHAPQHATT